MLLLLVGCGDNLDPGPDPVDAVLALGDAVSGASAPDAGPVRTETACDREELSVVAYPDGVTIMSWRRFAVVPFAGGVDLCGAHCLGDSCEGGCPAGAECSVSGWRPPDVECWGPVATYRRAGERWVYCGSRLSVDHVFGGQDDVTLGVWYEIARMAL